MRHDSLDMVPPAGAAAWLRALARGFRQRCPRCAKGHIFLKYLKVSPTCDGCGLALGSYRSDDAPPYFTILVVGHVVVPLILLVERAVQPAEWLQMTLWLPVAAGLTLFLLPRIKGAVIGWQWVAECKG